jgi:hypothetical protein
MPIGVAGVRFCESAPTGFDRPLEISPLEAISGPPFSGRNPGTEYGPTLLGTGSTGRSRLQASPGPASDGSWSYEPSGASVPLPHPAPTSVDDLYPHVFRPQPDGVLGSAHAGVVIGVVAQVIARARERAVEVERVQRQNRQASLGELAEDGLEAAAPDQQEAGTVPVERHQIAKAGLDQNPLRRAAGESSHHRWHRLAFERSYVGDMPHISS